MIAVVETKVQSLAEKIRARMAGGAGVWEITGMELPGYMAQAVGNEKVEAAFVSFHACVAITEAGRTVVCRVPERH